MRPFRMPPKPASGAVAVMVAITLVVLVAFAGLALDLGRLFIHKSELQNAVDACALAGARELNVQVKNLAVFTRAENAGITVAARNLTNFQDAGVALVTDRDVTFATTLDGSYSIKTAAPPDARYVRCTTEQTGIVPWFMGVLGIGPKAVGATAVAWMGPGITTCAIPVAMCTESAVASAGDCPQGTVWDPTSHLCIGKWYVGRYGAGGGTTGAYGWVDFDKSAERGAKAIKLALEGPGVCDLPLNPAVSQNGEAQGAATPWNSRFGVYKQGGGNPQPADAPPDFTGYGYALQNWPTTLNAYPNFESRREAYAPYDFSDGVLKPGSYKASTSETHRHGGDRRVVLMPLVKCTELAAGATPVLGWTCMLMLSPIGGPDDVALEYRGMAGDAGVPCGTYGQGGGVPYGPPVPTLVQ